MHSLIRVLAAAMLLAAGVVPLAAHADPCSVEINGNDLMQYDKQELTVPANCKDITVTLHHTGRQPREAMGHNWVLVSAADLGAVANAGLGAGLASDYVAAHDPRVIAHTRVVGGGQSASVTFARALLRPGVDYRYLCTFPGHNALMRGTFRIG